MLSHTISITFCTLFNYLYNIIFVFVLCLGHDNINISKTPIIFHKEVPSDKEEMKEKFRGKNDNNIIKIREFRFYFLVFVNRSITFKTMVRSKMVKGYYTVKPVS